MPILTYSIQSHELSIHTDHGYLALTPYTPRLIRIRYNLQPEFSSKASLIVTAQPDPAVPFQVQETPDSLLFSTSAMTIAIDRQTTAFTYRDRQGNLLTKEPAHGGKTLDPIDVFVSVFDESTAIESRST